MANYVSKTGIATYTVITDTHSYHWGIKEADIDLGDNTNADGTERGEAIGATSTELMTLYGNHDVQRLIYENSWETDPAKKKPLLKGLQCVPVSEDKVLLIGFDCATDVNTYIIPSEQITGAAQMLTELDTDWDVVVLMHVPMFPYQQNSALPDSQNTWECWTESEEKKWDKYEDMYSDTDRRFWMKSPRELLRILAAFQCKSSVTYDGVTYNYSTKTSNNVIGCFFGHIHNGVKCAISLNDYVGETGTSAIDTTPIYMEAFRTNGSAEYDKEKHSNAGWYLPAHNLADSKIVIDFDAKTVNGTSYVNPTIPYIVNIGGSGSIVADTAEGAYETKANYGFYPKFNSGYFCGWNTNVTGGATSFNNNNYFEIGNVYVHGLEQMENIIEFSINGLLRYHGELSKVTQERQEIEGYDSINVWFVSDDGNKWYFENGRHIYTAPVDIDLPLTPRSGTLVGQNGYTITFDANGLATGIRHNGTAATYPAGDNWVNVSAIRIYTDFANQPDWYTSIVQTAQVGITGTFTNAKAINMARSTIYGANRMEASPFALMRVLDWAGNVFWFYDGILMNLTDADIEGITPYSNDNIVGQNGYSIVFNPSGYARTIDYYGTEQDYGSGANWIHVSSINLYSGSRGNLVLEAVVPNTPRIGITGTFGSQTRINKIFSSIVPNTNYMSDDILWIRVEDDEGTVHWLYDGRMTSHTDRSMYVFVPSYTSATIVGKNGYKITCDANGYPTAVTYNNVVQSYSAGDNWINVSTIRVYPDYFANPADYIYTANAAQVGITGTFSSSTNEILNMARSTVNGENYLEDDPNVIVRVRDENGTNHWFYNGRHTDFTDEDMEK